MTSNVIFFAWNRPVPGREDTSAAHFQEFVEFLGHQQQQGAVSSFAPVLLDPHGGDMNGFFLIQGDPDRLHALTSSHAWMKHMVRAGMHLDGMGVIGGATGDLLTERMDLWNEQMENG